MIRRVFLAFLVFGLVACDDDSTGPEDIAGTYTLVTVDGEALPVVAEEIGTTYVIELTAGSATLHEDLTCSLGFTQRVTDNGTVTTGTSTTLCTYTLNDGALTLTLPPLNDTIDGSISGSTLTLNGNVGVLVYRK